MTLHVIYAVIGYFIFSAAVGAMLPPETGKERGFYGWFYRTLQRLAANADRVAEAKFGNIVGQASGSAVIAREHDTTVIATTK